MPRNLVRSDSASPESRSRKNRYGAAVFRRLTSQIRWMEDEPDSDADVPLALQPSLVRQQSNPTGDEELSSSRYLLAKGAIHFWKNFAYEDQGRPFVCLRHDINPAEVTRDVMQSSWHMNLPSFVLLVVSHSGPLSQWTPTRQLDNFKQGLIKAANTTDMWIVTNGLNLGMSKEIGDAVRLELLRRRALRCHKHPSRNRARVPPLTLVGIVREDTLMYAHCLDGRQSVVQLENEGNRPEENKFELNPDHSHYIVVRDDTVNRTGLGYFTLKLEQSMATDLTTDSYGTSKATEASMDGLPVELPLLSLLVAGDITCVRFLHDHLKRQMPLVVLEGSGGLADLLAFAYHQVQRRGTRVWDAEFVETFLKPELSSTLCELCPSYRENPLARNFFRDKIVECIWLACQQQRALLTVVDIRSQACNLADIDEVLLKAVFKAQRPNEQLWHKQMRKDLLLTLDWNCPHVAMSEVFLKDPSCKFQVDRDIFELALLRPGREEFVRLFLDRGFQVHRYLTPRRLKQLFQRVQHEEFFRSLCWEGVLGHGLSSKIGKHFVENELNWLISTLAGLQNFVDPQELSMNAALGIYTQDPCAAERKALVVLSLWGAFTQRTRLCQLLWQGSDQPIHLALLLSGTYARLALRVHEGTTRRTLQEASKEFASMARGVLDCSYQEATCRAYDVLSEENPDWGYKTAVDIAAEMRNRTFLAHPCCQKWITNLFMGGIRVRELTWGIFTCPLWLKIILCAFLVFPMYIWVSFKSDPHEMEYKEEADIEEEKEDKEEDQLLPSGGGDSVLKADGAGSPPGRKSFNRDAMTTLLREREVFLPSPPPLWKMVQQLWMAPITKFWTFQLFYMMYLAAFSVAVLWPSCGQWTLDVAVCSWTLLITLESIRRTYVLYKKYMRSVPLFMRCVEIALMVAFVGLYLCGRVLYPAGEILHPYTTKVILCSALLGFYYRQIVIYLPISSTLGPLLYKVRLMVVQDFANFMRMALLVIISGGIVAHALLYPDFPFSVELVRRAFHRAWFALFLTHISDLEEDSRCSKLKYTEKQEEGACRVSMYSDYTCSNPGVWPYIFIIQFLVLLKLVLLTLLYALFSNTARKIEEASDDIWKFQRYQLVVDFMNRLCLPPPLNIISYFITAVRFLCHLCTCKFCRKVDETDCSGAAGTELSHAQRLSEKDYNYWRQLAFQYSQKIKEEKTADDLTKKQSESISVLLDDLDNQRRMQVLLKGQVQELQRTLGRAQAHLETLNMGNTIHLRAEGGRSAPALSGGVHVLSRHSPYPSTRVQRYPVPDKYVAWEVLWLDYDPVAYTRPCADFPGNLQPYVDEDILYLKLRETSSAAQQVPTLTWNCVSTSPAGISIDRRSWILDSDGSPVIYKLDSMAVPMNPIGRTGLRGKGALPRWGPNHYILFVISRWQRSKIHLVGGRGLEIVLMRICRTDQFSMPGDFVPGEHKYEMMKLLFKGTDQRGCSSAEDVSLLFQNSCLPENNESPSDMQQPMLPNVTCKVVQQGYMDDPMNTDHCWREVELWHIHFTARENLQEQFQLRGHHRASQRILPARMQTKTMKFKAAVRLQVHVESQPTAQVMYIVQSEVVFCRETFPHMNVRR
ncbi:transient receptor potential cation channel subfamily M member 2-like isoform X2 [Ornithodoros turicata]|uniref:transient receptor potential cation channel subfamily M member 2-like isoform X2 n=1 Tax=Ornithodoros turicata TaxID=34597 RepID=UPI00313913D9